jgi:acid phosphatase
MRDDNTGRGRSSLPYNEQEQLRWLEGELSISRAAWKIVVGHHPVYSGGKHGGTKRLVDWLTPLFKRYGVQVYLAGHNHNLEHLVVDGTHYLVSGGGAEPNRVATLDTAEFGSGRLGFLAARLSADSMRIKFVNEKGRPIYRATIPLGV